MSFIIRALGFASVVTGVCAAMLGLWVVAALNLIVGFFLMSEE